MATIHLKAAVESFSVVPYIVSSTLNSCGAVYYAVQGGSNFRVCEWNPTM